MSLSSNLSRSGVIPALLTLILASCDVLAPPTTRSASVGHSITSDDRRVNLDDSSGDEDNSSDATAKKSKNKGSTPTSDEPSDSLTGNEPTRFPVTGNPSGSKTNTVAIDPSNRPDLDPLDNGKQVTTSAQTNVQTSTATSPVQNPINPATQSPVQSPAQTPAQSPVVNGKSATSTDISTTTSGAATPTTTTSDKLCFLVGSQPDRQQVDPQSLVSCKQVFSVQVNCAGKSPASTTQVVQLPDTSVTIKTRSAYAASDLEELDETDWSRSERDETETFDETLEDREDVANLRCSDAKSDIVKSAMARTSYQKCVAVNVSIATVK